MPVRNTTSFTGSINRPAVQNRVFIPEPPRRYTHNIIGGTPFGFGIVGSSNMGDAVSVSTRNVPVPAGLQAGDYVYIFFGQWNSNANITVTPPDGTWSQKLTWSSGDGFARNSLWVKHLTGADSGTYNFTFNAAAFTTINLVAVRGALTTDPIGTKSNSSVGTWGTPASISVGGGISGDLALYFAYNDTPGTHTPPTGFTELIDNDCAETAYQILTGTGITATGQVISTSSAAGQALVVISADGVIVTQPFIGWGWGV
jgi:hypothetical protein